MGASTRDDCENIWVDIRVVEENGRLEKKG